MRLVKLVFLFIFCFQSNANESLDKIPKLYDFVKGVNLDNDLINAQFDIYESLENVFVGDIKLKNLTLDWVIKNKHLFGENYAFSDKPTKLDVSFKGCVDDNDGGFIALLADGILLKDKEPVSLCEKASYVYAKFLFFSAVYKQNRSVYIDRLSGVIILYSDNNESVSLLILRNNVDVGLSKLIIENLKK